MARLRRDQLRRVYGRAEKRCRECWEARVPTPTALRLCQACQARRDELKGPQAAP